ncbi:cholecystokinin receptor type A-like [Haliotis rufescens]|uniref:cholecystokinin receptor type A-like n=1 Tax=Haliotis rufescens TaxID=6454 RepID=UPI001EAF8D86|nr:cholecystokinin receptor type A-like [Haliotis rufescens]
MDNDRIYNLTEVSNGKALLLLPVSILAAILMLLGIVGNTAVITVIWKRMPKNAINSFILTLAMFDLFSCVACSPLDIVELRYPHEFPIPGLCKLLRFARTLSTSSSGFLLIAIATERYRLICKYKKSHMSASQAWKTCGVIFVVATVISTPSVVLFGSKTVALQGGLNGTECSISDSYKGSIFPVLFYSLLIFLFFGTFISLCVLYAFVGIQIWKGRKIRTKRFSSMSALSRDTVNAALNNTLEALEFPCDSLKRTTSFFGERAQKAKEYSRRRTTLIMVAITSVFLTSCLPYIIVAICRFLIKDIDSYLTETGEVFFHFSLKSFMFSPVLNPYIYGYCNERFKRELLKLAIVKTIQKKLQKGDNSDTSQSPTYSAANNDEVDK